MREVKILLALLFSVFAISCGVSDSNISNSDDPTDVSLIDHDLWEIVPDSDACAADAYGAEVLAGSYVLAIHTDNCHSITVTQKLPKNLKSGNKIQITMFHGDLYPRPDDVFIFAVLANLYVRIGSEVIWSTKIGIPSDAAFLDETVVVATPHKLGEPVQFHVNNHGANEYALISINLKR